MVTLSSLPMISQAFTSVPPVVGEFQGFSAIVAAFT
jgi:hypothetical protein